MKDLHPFIFKRSKGIVWVCDLADSSSYLNDNISAGDIENFIPRFYYVSKLVIESYGGKFLKWTGDGFLCFFEFELDRQKEEIAALVFEAAEHITFMSNITQLGLTPEKDFTIRHGITYEKDALLIKMSLDKESESMDIIGRAVVLAFRLASIKVKFPSIATMKELTKKSVLHFAVWKPTLEDKLKHFKGQQFGTDSIMISSDKARKSRSIKSAKKNAVKAINNFEHAKSVDENNPVNVFVNKMLNGPEWCQDIIKKEASFIELKLLGTLKEIVAALDDKKNGL